MSSQGLNRREFLGALGALAAGPWLPRGAAQSSARAETLVNDVHSRLNLTRVRAIERPDALDALCGVVRSARDAGHPISICGGRHAMGGQQFGTDGLLIDLNGLQRVLGLDAQRGIVEVEAGIQWPALLSGLRERQRDAEDVWTIVQKQTGADRLSLGGALAANVHGRGLKWKPIVGDVESFTLIDADGVVRTCSRNENAELFALAIGGYGLFGVVASVRLRLRRRCKVQRVVEMVSIDELMRGFERSIADGCLYGDFQFTIDPTRDDFLQRGVLACYRPVPAKTPLTENARHLSAQEWSELVRLAHVDKARAFELYAAHYTKTNGQVYWSDTHQLSPYLEDYHVALDRGTNAAVPASEIITEIYVPPGSLADFMRAVALDFRRNDVHVIYGTVRLIEADDQTFLPWARQAYACVIFNLHTQHTAAELEGTAGHFRRLIDLALERGGSYYLTYHRFASRAQVEACHPRFREFLRLKRKYDPRLAFQSDWYRHYRRVFEEA